MTSRLVISITQPSSLYFNLFSHLFIFLKTKNNGISTNTRIDAKKNIEDKVNIKQVL